MGQECVCVCVCLGGGVEYNAIYQCYHVQLLMFNFNSTLSLIYPHISHVYDSRDS